MTDDLIDTLARDLAPVPRFALLRALARPVLAGVALAAVIMVPWLGLRPDIATAWLEPVFWLKFGYTAALSLLSYLAVLRLARPGGGPGAAGRRILTVVGLLAVAALAQLALAPPEARMALVVGGTLLVCPLYIVALSIPVLAATMWALRRAAPTNLPLAGLVAGAASGATGAWVYAFHCAENGLPFLALWYTLGIVAVAAIGGLTGRLLLRW